MADMFPVARGYPRGIIWPAAGDSAPLLVCLIAAWRLRYKGPRYLTETAKARSRYASEPVRKQINGSAGDVIV
jgi:hypothetical protein